MVHETRTNDSVGRGSLRPYAPSIEAFVWIRDRGMCNSVRVSRMMLDRGERIAIVAAERDRCSGGQLGPRRRRVQIGARRHQVQIRARLGAESTGVQIGARSANAVESESYVQIGAHRSPDRAYHRRVQIGARHHRLQFRARASRSAIPCASSPSANRCASAGLWRRRAMRRARRHSCGDRSRATDGSGAPAPSRAIARL